eukprot:scaffold89658_cov37-Tisochrysis_lutea.AAC.1
MPIQPSDLRWAGLQHTVAVTLRPTSSLSLRLFLALRRQCRLRLPPPATIAARCRCPLHGSRLPISTSLPKTFIDNASGLGSIESKTRGWKSRAEPMSIFFKR